MTFQQDMQVMQDNMQYTQPCAINGIVFHINPFSYSMTSQRIIANEPTSSGVIRFSYGFQPTKYTLDGSTGTAGKAEIQRMERSLRPSPQYLRRDLLVDFFLPARFKGVRKVYIDVFTDSMSNDLPMFHMYHIELSEYDTPYAYVRYPNNVAPPIPATNS